MYAADSVFTLPDRRIPWAQTLQEPPTNRAHLGKHVFHRFPAMNELNEWTNEGFKGKKHTIKVLKNSYLVSAEKGKKYDIIPSENIPHHLGTGLPHSGRSPWLRSLIDVIHKLRLTHEGAMVWRNDGPIIDRKLKKNRWLDSDFFGICKVQNVESCTK